MATMRRGANVALTREIPQLTGVVLGVRLHAGAERAVIENAVVAAILCNGHGQALTSEHFVFFNQLASPDLSVTQLERALGDDHEQIEIDLGAVPADVARIVMVMYLNDGIAARRSFGQLRTCVVRVLNLADDVELVHSENLAAGLTTETGLALGEMYRHQGGWKFKVIGQGYNDGVAGIAKDYGVRL
ncbi:TerD family protein [Spirilliplanes yamanashiensis]|uniref:Chemical-damaging agent resistance protein C n=1 Tax=Spirilliplanes yamanashiensis TaxID=42233 RepID=A0A8J4DJD9_9ACTN|nr:TerD family protein [Spirilliplanes yamanashiensis]MDP9817213.1 tellurium resistance protein TerD [Spirilliplanes yamanashiensis]GIJ03133.1 chemical-damaging agent resistance protein C [Spirilliplanes yamanashiensis]